MDIWRMHRRPLFCLRLALLVAVALCAFSRAAFGAKPKAGTAAGALSAAKSKPQSAAKQKLTAGAAASSSSNQKAKAPSSGKGRKPTQLSFKEAIIVPQYIVEYAGSAGQRIIWLPPLNCRKDAENDCIICTNRVSSARSLKITVMYRVITASKTLSMKFTLSEYHSARKDYKLGLVVVNLANRAALGNSHVPRKDARNLTAKADDKPAPVTGCKKKNDQFDFGPAKNVDTLPFLTEFVVQAKAPKSIEIVYRAKIQKPASYGPLSLSGVTTASSFCGAMQHVAFWTLFAGVMAAVV